MRKEHLVGLVAAPFTPMDPSGKLNLSVIPRYFDLLISNGVNGAFICGSTGEGVSLTTRERMQVAALHAQSLGLYGVSFTAPFYFKPPDVQALADSCAAIAEAVPDTRFYYYHIPVLTGVYFPMLPLLKAIDAKLPNFAGIKYTHEDFMDYLSCLHFQDGKYDLLWGRDENWVAAMALGAKGAVGSTYNYAAPLYHRMTEAFQQGDLEKARRLQQQSIDMIRLLGKYGGIATGKAFMKVLGLDCGAFRLPVKNMPEEQFKRFKEDVENLGFRDYCSRLP